MARVELFVVPTTANGARVRGGEARLRARRTDETLVGAEQAAGHRFELNEPGEYALTFEPEANVPYCWRFSLLSLGDDLYELRPDTCLDSTSSTVVRVRRDGRTRAQATLGVALHTYWDDRQRELVGLTRDYEALSPYVVNQRETAQYARMYLSDPDTFKWAGMAAFASKAVGDGLREAGAIATAAWMTRPLVGPGIEASPPAEISRRAWFWLAMGNRLVYRDMFWQHLAYRECGIAMIDYEAAQSRMTSLARGGWEMIDHGRREGDVRLVWEGNAKLLEQEQKHTLHERIYSQDPILWRLLSLEPVRLAHPLRSPVPGDPSVFEGDDFGDREQRWAWVSQTMVPAWMRLDADRARVQRLLEAML